VIHAVHSFYMTDMGATRKYLPVTWGFTLIAALSLMGVPPFPGFWSKDAVLLVTIDASWPLFVVALVTAAVTACYTVRFFGLVFHGQPNAHVDTTGRTNDHLPDGDISMRLASGALAVAIVVAGLGGPSLERVLHHAFEVSAFHGDLGSMLAAGPQADESLWHGLVPTLSVLFVIAGAVPAYLLYVTGRWTAQSLIDRSPVLRWLHAFFRNRWTIDRIFTRVFVTGTARLGRWVADDSEARLDNMVHRRLPWVFTGLVQRLIDNLRADTEELLYNVSYVLILFVMLVTYLLLETAGG